MIQVFILNGSEYALKLFNNFDLHTYNAKLALSIMFIYVDNILYKKVTNFDNEYLYNIWLNLCSYQTT